VFLGTAVTGLVLLIVFLLIQSNGGFSGSRLLIRLSMVSGALFILGSIGWGLSVLSGVNHFLTASWRGPVFLGGGLVAIIALFYGVENWRGARAWRSFKETREARGERFEMSHYIPPAVPVERNFFETALWEHLHFTQPYNEAEGTHEVVWGDKNWGQRTHFRISSPNSREEPPLVAWPFGKPVALEEWQAYYRGSNNLVAAESGGFTNYFPVPANPRAPAADVLLALSRLDGDRRLLAQASGKPESRFWIEYNAGYEAALPHLSELKQAARYLSLHAESARLAGDKEAALADIQMGFHLLRTIRSEPFTISHRVRSAMLALILQPVWGGCADHQWTAADLEGFEKQLREMDFLADYHFAMRGERAFNLAFIDRAHIDSRRVSSGIVSAYSFAHQNQQAARVPLCVSLAQAFGTAPLKLAPRGWFEQNKRSLCNLHESVLLAAVDLTNRVVSPRIVRKATSALKEQPVGMYNAILALQIHTGTDVPNGFAYGQTMVDLARVACALEKYRLAQGKYPASLEKLMPGYIEVLPHDIINGQPLTYRLTGSGQFLLYSVGWNELDDAGEAAGHLERAEETESGDWVWKYPAMPRKVHGK
jgi:hypothetical protein